MITLTGYNILKQTTNIMLQNSTNISLKHKVHREKTVCLTSISLDELTNRIHKEKSICVLN